MLNLFLALHKSVPEKFTIRDVIAAAYINVYVRYTWSAQDYPLF
jgi:hypothetical protein